jgi:hypothetical protein
MGDSGGGWKTGKVIALYRGNNGWKIRFPNGFLQREPQQPAEPPKGKSKTLC